jgi:pimeloyl-ACP methyl ester carboxylesterase
MAITAHKVQTPRLGVHLLDTGGAGKPVLLIHGNCSSGIFFRGTMERLPPGVRGIAPDLRGYGGTDPLPIDATRGVRDFSDDIYSLVKTLDLGGQKPYLVGWSVGGGVIMQYAIDHPEEVAGLVLLAPMAPYGFGGSRGLDGKPCYDDFAGSGAGGANPEFVARLRSKDRSSDSPFSPRSIMNGTYFKPPFRLPQEEEDIGVSSMLEMRISEDHYPGDAQTSPNWPGVAPGARGVNNALSPKYCNLSGFANISPRPKVLWVRGADDSIVSDTSFYDFGFLGQLGLVPGWPGAEVFPPQPMVGQMRAVLEAYKQNGGQYEELVFAECGHSPHLEKPEAFDKALHAFIG